MIQQTLVIVVPQGGEAEQRGVVAERHRELRFAECLRGETAHAGDQDRTGSEAPVVHGAPRQVEDRLQQLHAGIADGELRGVHADGDAAGAGIAVVPRQRHLAPLVELARFGHGERVGRNHQAAQQCAAKFRPPIALRSAHPSPRSGSACSATIRRSAPSAPPTAAAPQAARPDRRAATGSGSNR